MTTRKRKHSGREVYRGLKEIKQYCPNCNVPTSDDEATICPMCYSKLKHVYEPKTT